MGRDIKASPLMRPKPSRRALPAQLQQLREKILGLLQTQLAQVLANCDDAFFDLSSRAKSNTEQTLYFESMREVRGKRDLILTDSRTHFHQCFDSLLGPQNSMTTEQSLVQDGLSLVADDDIEQDVALSSMVTKARADNQEALYHIQCRMDALLPGFRTNEQNNPLDPEALCRAFKSATAELELDIKPRIVLFKQFDLEVIQHLSELYQAANALLIDAGVLPTIKSTIKKQTSKAAPGGSQNTAEYPLEAEASVAPAYSHDLSELSHLLAGLRSLNNRPAAFIPRYSNRSGPVVSQEELVRLLADLQASISYEEILHQQTLDIRGAIEQVMASIDAGGDSEEHALETPDEDVINLVAMFFDFVLNDPALPLPFQALIGRLQLPILKLALKDNGFFNTNRHPARTLINDIARAGVGCDDDTPSTKDRIAATIESIIQAIHDSPDADLGLFESMRSKLEAVASKERHKAELVEKRARETASGQSRTHAARNKVHYELHQRLKSAEIPEGIGKFLLEDWQPVLLLTYLNHGEDSAEWLEALQLVDDLIWSVGQHVDEKSKARRARLLPMIERHIRKGLAKTLTSEADIQARVDSVAAVHNLLLQGQIEELHFSRLPAEREASLASDEAKSWKEMTAVERQQARQKRITYDFISKAEALRPGTWMQFEDPASSKRVRCKLAAVLPETETYVFVNRLGFKALEKKRKEVAYELQQKRASIIDSSPLFDRAFSKIADNLREMGQASAG